MATNRDSPAIPVNQLSPRSTSSAHPPVILASTSAYRKMLLSRLGLRFTTEAPGIDETPVAGEDAPAMAERLAREKARAVAQRHPGAIVIGSDQVAICAGRRLGKPGSIQKALEQLQFQAGKTTVFHTAVCLARVSPVEKLADQEQKADLGQTQDLRITTVRTTVTWRSARELPPERLARYLALENPIDCAGAAKAEGLGLTLIASIDSGDPTALIGLPLIAVTDGLIALGLDPLEPSP